MNNYMKYSCFVKEPKIRAFHSYLDNNNDNLGIYS